MNMVKNDCNGLSSADDLAACLWRGWRPLLNTKLMRQAMRKFVFLYALSAGFFPLLVHAQEAALLLNEDFWETATAQDVVEILESGADVGIRNVEGATPLHFAAVYSTVPEVISVLLDAGADIEARNRLGLTPLHYAAGYNLPFVISLLLDRGADSNVKNERGETPFDLAERNLDLEGSDAYWRLNEGRFQ